MVDFFSAKLALCFDALHLRFQIRDERTIGVDQRVAQLATLVSQRIELGVVRTQRHLCVEMCRRKVHK